MSEAKLTGISFNIKTSVGSSSTSIEKLAKSLETLKKASEGIADVKLKELGQNIRSFGTAVGNNLSDDKIQNINKLSTALNKISKVQKIDTDTIDNISSGVSNIAKSIDKVTNEQIEKIERLGNALKNFKVSKSIINNFNQATSGNVVESPDRKTESTPSDANAIVNDMQSNASSTTSVISKLTSSASTLKSKLAEGFNDASKGVAVLFDGLTKLNILKKIGSSAKEVGKAFKNWAVDKLTSPVRKLTKGFDGLFSAMKRIALYSTVRYAITLLSDALKGGIENLYQYSKAFSGTFATAMDSLATSWLYLKNSMAAMVSPLIEAVAPAVQYVVDKFATLLNVVNQVFAKLTGASTYTKAKRISTEYAVAIDDAAKNASDSADKLKKSVLGFDELNQLTDNSSTTTSSTTTNDVPLNSQNYGDMFTTESIDSGISDFVEKIQSFIKNGKWKELGETLGNYINKAVDSVDWAKSGKKFGKYVNNFFTTLYWTLKTVDFKKLGKNLATWINNAFKTIKWKTVGRTIGRSITGAADLVIGFLGTIDWGELTSDIGKFVSGFFTEIAEWLSSANKDGVKAGTAIVDNICDAIEGLADSDAGESLWKFISSSLSLAGQVGWGLLFESIKKTFENNSDNPLEIPNPVTISINTILSIAKWTIGSIFGKDTEVFDGVKVGDILDGTATKDSSINFALEVVTSLGKAVKDKVSQLKKDWNDVVNAIFGENPTGIIPKILRDALYIDDSSTGNLAADFTLSIVFNAIASLSDKIKSKLSQLKSDWNAVIDEIFGANSTGILKKIHDFLYIGSSSTGDATATLGIEITPSFKSGSITGTNNTLSFTGVLTALVASTSLGGAPASIVSNFLSGKTSSTSIEGSVTKLVNAVGDASRKTLFGKILTGATSVFKLAGKTTDITNGVSSKSKTKSSLVGKLLSGATSVFKLSGSTTDIKNGVSKKSKTKSSLVSKILSGGTSSFNLNGKTTGLSNGLSKGTKRTLLSNILSGSTTGFNLNGKATIEASGTYAKKYLSNILETLTPGKDTYNIKVTINELKQTNKALGGILKNGSWSSLPQYASGGNVSHGSVFIAGESGAEAVAHIGGQTEVLNQSQLASVMYSSVLAGMSVLSSKMVTCTNAVISSNLATDPSDASDRMVSATERQNRLLEQQNEYLRKISEKDTTTTITSGMIATAVKNHNRRSGNMSAIVY